MESFCKYWNVTKCAFSKIAKVNSNFGLLLLGLAWIFQIYLDKIHYEKEISLIYHNLSLSCQLIASSRFSTKHINLGGLSGSWNFHCMHNRKYSLACIAFTNKRVKIHTFSNFNEFRSTLAICKVSIANPNRDLCTNFIQFWLQWNHKLK